MFPVDLEVCGRNISLPSHTWLIEDRVIPLAHSGLNRFLTSIFNSISPIHFVYGYIQNIKMLNEIGVKLSQILLQENGKRPFISRLIFRKTMSYQKYLQGVSEPKDFRIPLFEDEKLQLDRGDVPYFFRYLNGDPTIYIYNENMQAEGTSLHKNHEFKKLILHPNFIMNKSVNVFGQHFKSLLGLGSLQLAKNSLHWLGVSSYAAEFSDLIIRLDSGNHFLKTKDFSYCTQT
ncbi:MAG: hypothetical protein H6625_03490 [Bdellovibrionaceae bacterium]|nr:hypothetical protein [Pseudobdellovibrionaceae bacterium]